jgi:hypothetical protein
MTSASRLMHLADELKLAIVGHLEQEQGHQRAILNLSATCRRFRELLKPVLFKRVCLKNSKTSAKLMQEFLEGSDKVYVKELHYIGGPQRDEEEDLESDANGDEGDGSEDEDGSEDDASSSGYPSPATILPKQTRDILEHLDRFPNIERVVVEFREDLDFDYPFWDICHHEDEAGNMDEAASKEARLASRALLAKTSDAIAENWSKNSIKSFELRNHPALLVSSWAKPNFRILLKSLTQFRISTFEAQSESACTNTFLEWDDFVFALGRYLMSQLHNVETLYFGGSIKGPIGCEGDLHAPNPMEPDFMPKLRELYLSYVILDLHLIDFITGHAVTLETLSMEDCYAETGHLEEGGQTWADFFGAIADCGPKKLRKLKVEWQYFMDMAPSLKEDQTPSEEEEEFCENQASNTRSRELNANAFGKSQKKPFAYCEIVSKMQAQKAFPAPNARPKS